MLRVLLGINVLAALASLAQSPGLAGWLEHYIELAAVVQPLLLIGLGLLSLVRDALWRLPLRLGQACVLGLAGGLAGLLYLYAASLGLADGGSIGRTTLLAMAATALMLVYFDLRSRAFSPVLSEARLAALNARIRPHFLFNSLNAVLSLIRARPQQAEEALESLSDLFRAAMRDPGELVSLADEIALGKQYLELEKLRLGDRLAGDWKIGAISMGLPIPPLMLQPLLENAVYHGVQASNEASEVSINIYQRHGQFHAILSNPIYATEKRHSGNRMAINNIRERLALHFDAEAGLSAKALR